METSTEFLQRAMPEEAKALGVRFVAGYYGGETEFDAAFHMRIMVSPASLTRRMERADLQGIGAVGSDVRAAGGAAERVIGLLVLDQPTVSLDRMRTLELRSVPDTDATMVSVIEFGRTHDVLFTWFFDREDAAEVGIVAASIDSFAWDPGEGWGRPVARGSGSGVASFLICGGLVFFLFLAIMSRVFFTLWAKERRKRILLEREAARINQPATRRDPRSGH